MKRTKLITLLLVIVAVFALSISASASEPVEVADPDLAFTAEAPSVVSAGGTVTVNVNVPVNAGFTWAQVTMTYDADVLTYVEDKDDPNFSTEGTQFPSAVKVATKSGDRIVITIGTMPGFSKTLYEQTGFVVAVTFNIAEGYEDVTNVNLSTSTKNIVDADGKPDNLTVSTGGCVLKVVDWATHVHTEEVIPGKAPTCTEPGLTEGKKCSFCGTLLVAQLQTRPTSHTASDEWEFDADKHWHICANCDEKFDEADHVLSDDGHCECGYYVPTFIYGDANGDGKVNSADIILIKKYVANFDKSTGTSTVEVSLGADANGDGKINSSDIILLKKYIANLDSDGNSTVVLGPAKEA